MVPGSGKKVKTKLYTAIKEQKMHERSGGEDVDKQGEKKVYVKI